MSSRLLFLAAAAAAGLWAFRNWRRAVQLAMVLLILEGAVRKWLLPGAQDLVYFAKDGLLLAAYAGFLTSGGARTRGASGLRDPLLTALIFGAVTVGAAQVFNPHLPNLLVGLLGFKAYFFYIPLLWLVPASFRDREELWRFLYLYVLLAVPLGLLALLQFGSPASSPLNTYARGGGDAGVVSTFGSSAHVRVTSTFSYISGYVSYLFATALLLLSLLATVRWRLRSYLLVYAAFGFTLLGMLVSGSRAPVLMFAVAFPLYWWLTAARDRPSFTAVSRVLLVIGVLGLGLAYGADEAVEAFFGRARAAQDMGSRILSPLIQPFELAGRAGLFGYGIGSTHQAAGLLVDDGARMVTWVPGLIVEDESGRVMIELGIIGFAAVYGLRIHLLVLAFRQSLRFRDRFCRAVGVASLLFFLMHLPSGIIFNVTSGLYYWFFAGLLFLAVRLDREDASAADPARVAASGPAVGGVRPAPAASHSFRS